MTVDVCVLFGRRIRQLRTEAGMSQEQLSGRADISQANLSLIENGKAEPGLRTQYDLARALGVTMAELFTKVD